MAPAVFYEFNSILKPWKFCCIEITRSGNCAVEREGDIYRLLPDSLLVGSLGSHLKIQEIDLAPVQSHWGQPLIYDILT
jgi:hypothetical protein